VQDESSLWFDRSAEVDGDIRRNAPIDIQLCKQVVESDPWNDSAQSYAERPSFIVDTHRDHSFLESRVAHPGHGEQELST
jgi:hypothetical protein